MLEALKLCKAALIRFCWIRAQTHVWITTKLVFLLGWYVEASSCLLFADQATISLELINCFLLYLLLFLVRYKEYLTLVSWELHF